MSQSANSYPGGKSGAGIYQRLINMIPRHRIRRRQKNWREQLNRMPEQERLAMLEVLNRSKS